MTAFAWFATRPAFSDASDASLGASSSPVCVARTQQAASSLPSRESRLRAFVGGIRFPLGDSGRARSKLLLRDDPLQDSGGLGAAMIANGRRGAKRVAISRVCHCQRARKAAFGP